MLTERLDACSQFALTANEAELRDPFQVGAGHAGGVIQGDDLRNFLKDKLIRTFVKKGVRPVGACSLLACSLLACSLQKGGRGRSERRQGDNFCTDLHAQTIARATA